MRCPACNSHQIGKVGSNQFYCWNCFVEFNLRRGKAYLYDVAEDGSLISREESYDIIG